MHLNSTAFENNSTIPKQFSAEGRELSPELIWSQLPQNCKELALFVEDPDAGSEKDPFTHWLVYNIPPTLGSLPEGLPNREKLDTPVCATQGRNSSGEVGYTGPLPPIGDGRHHYVFTLYALDQKLDLKPGLKRNEVLKSIENHVLAQTKLIGTYERAELL